jgi:hypothetical protein
VLEDLNSDVLITVDLCEKSGFGVFVVRFYPFYKPVILIAFEAELDAFDKESGLERKLEIFFEQIFTVNRGLMLSSYYV